jgi:hypothetical protein
MTLTPETCPPLLSLLGPIFGYITPNAGIAGTTTVPYNVPRISLSESLPCALVTSASACIIRS